MKSAHLILFLMSGCLGGELAQAELSGNLKALLAVNNEGHGNVEASVAWREVIEGEPSSTLLPLLSAMDQANGLATNWIVSAAQVIGDKGALPMAELGAFLMDTRHAPRARQLAFELIERADPETAKKLIPGMIQDPATGLRRIAVGDLLKQAATLNDASKIDAATLLYQQALGAAREVDQVDAAAKALGDLGQTVDLAKHFGFLMDWKVIGPFDNTGLKGFDTVFPPEKGIDLTASYDGKNVKASWQELNTTNPYGMLDLNKAYGNLKEVTAYAYTEFDSDTARPVELRLGCKNAWKVWLNGELLFGRDEYHRGARIDQYRLPAQMKPGKNAILVKVCQNEQTEDWTIEWEFQLRVCDATGTAILSVNRPETASN